MRSLCRFSMYSSSSPAAAVPVLHRGSKGGSGTRDRDSGSGEGAIADTSEAQAAAQTVPAAEAISRTLPPPLFR